MSDTTNYIDVDVAIIGGGVAGLWALDSFIGAGYSSILLERDFLGNGQTIVSQGIIHGGIKYAFSADVRGDSVEELKGMPDRWREHLSGKRTPNLSGVRVSSEDMYLWVSKSHGLVGVAESLLSPIALKSLRTPAKKVEQGNAPCWLENSARTVYRVEEPIVDTHSLLEELARPNRRRIVYTNSDISHVDSEEVDQGINIQTITYDNFTVRPTFVVLTAGRSNQELATRLGVKEDIMQERPLRQVYVEGNLPEFYGHCIDHGRPDISITTHVPKVKPLFDSMGNNRVWNIGGKIAEDGLNISPEELIARTQKRISQALPEIDFTDASMHWSTFDAVRAEAKKGGERPGGVEVYQNRKLLVAWPTKLALAPVLADRLVKTVREMQEPCTPATLIRYADDSIRVASPIWEK